MKNILEYKTALTIAGASLLTVSGACWGYVFASAELEKEFDDRVRDAIAYEVERTRKFYALRYKDFQPEDVSEMDPDDLPDQIVLADRTLSIPNELVATEEGRQMIREALDTAIEPTPEPEEMVVQVNAFDAGAVPEYDEEALISNRSADKPYIISREEYMINAAHYEQHTLTYFDPDGALMSEDDDEMIPDINEVVGDGNMEMFGVMSHNNNVVYIQNDRSETMFCVNRSFLSAAKAIYGFDDDEEAIIEHSSMKPRRPRRDEH